MKLPLGCSAQNLTNVWLREASAGNILSPTLSRSWHKRHHDGSSCRVGLRHSIGIYGRCFHSAGKLNDNTVQSQAQPLGDFYTDLLSRPIPKASTAKSSLPTFVQSGDESKEERARKLFGNIEGSGYERRASETPDATWRTINGVAVPPRPLEPDNCCMSGCVHCVWDDYRDDIEDWAGRLRAAQAKGHTREATSSPKITMPRPEVAHASGSMDDDGGGSEALWQSPTPGNESTDDLFAGIPIGIREFMATEKRIRDRKIARKQQRGA